MKLFAEVYRLRLSVFTHWGTLALWWCANTETEKIRNRVLVIENRTEFEKSKLTQPYCRIAQMVVMQMSGDHTKQIIR